MSQQMGVPIRSTSRRPRVGVLGTDREFTGETGIMSLVTCRRQWIDRLLAAGALPIILPPRSTTPEEYLEIVDALVLPGGGDVDPHFYGQERRPETYSVDTERDEWEISIVNLALSEDRPVLSVCRGMQLLNVALGGTLNQHLPSDPVVGLNHFQADNYDRTVHDVHLDRDSLVGRAMIAASEVVDQLDPDRHVSLLVNSVHHQGLDLLGRHLVVTGRAEDGVVEAVQSDNHRFVVGVQWHPELLSDPTQAHALFGALVLAAS